MRHWTPPPGRDWEHLMDAALEEARLAEQAGETPIGAVLVSRDGHIVAASRNQSITLNDPTAHAEIMCLRMAGKRLGNYRLPGTILAVTLEPCLMCVGALIHARVDGVVFGARDPQIRSPGLTAGGKRPALFQPSFPVHRRNRARMNARTS